MHRAATQAKAEFAGDKPEGFSGTFVPLGINGHMVRDRLFVSGFDLGLIATQIQPSLRQVFKLPGVWLLWVDWAQKTVAGILTVVGTDVVDFSRQVDGGMLPRLPNWQVLLPTVSAKVGGVEVHALGLTPWGKALRIQGDVALARRLQRGEHLAGAADELV